MAAKGVIIKKAFEMGGKATSVAVPAYFALGEYNRSREEGKGKIVSLGRAGMDFAVSEALGWKYPFVGLAKALPSAAVNTYNTIDRMSRESSMVNGNTPFINSRFKDTQPAYTMRQYGMQLAQNSKYNLEQTLMGNEAQHFKY